MIDLIDYKKYGKIKNSFIFLPAGVVEDFAKLID